MGNKQSTKLKPIEDKLTNYKLDFQIDGKSIKLIAERKKKVANEEFVYFNMNKTIDNLLNKDISVTYINHSNDYHNIFKFKFELIESKFVVIHNIKYYELEYKSLPPIEKNIDLTPTSKLYCRYVSLDTNNISFVVTSPVIMKSS